MSLTGQLITQLTTMRNAVRRKRSLSLPLGAAWSLAATGAPLVVESGATDGMDLVDSESLGYVWNATSTAAIGMNVALPQDLDTAYPIDLNFLVSKSGATAADYSSLTVAAFLVAAGALHDADADCGGSTNAVTPNATAKRVAHLQRRIAASDVAAAITALPGFLMFSIVPAVITTDDFTLHGAWIDYTAKFTA